MLGSDKGIKLVSNDGKVFGNILGNVNIITLGLDIGTKLDCLDGSFDDSNEGNIAGLLLGESLVSTDVKVFGYDEDTAQAGLAWSEIHVVVMGWGFGGVGCHTTRKGAGLSCELDYTISF